MERHVHLNRLARNAITTMSHLECRDDPHSASCSTSFTDVLTNSNVLRQYGRITHRYRHLIIHPRRALPSHKRRQECSVSSPRRVANFITKRVTFDGHICTTRSRPSAIYATPSFTLRFFNAPTAWTSIFDARPTMNDSSIARRYHTVNQTLDTQQTPGIKSTARRSSQCDALIVNDFIAKPFCTQHNQSTNVLISTSFKELFSFFHI